MGLIYSWIKQEDITWHSDKRLNLANRLFLRIKMDDLANIIVGYRYEDYRKIFTARVIPVLNKGLIRNCKVCKCLMKFNIHQLRQYEMMDMSCGYIHNNCSYYRAQTCSFRCMFIKGDRGIPVLSSLENEEMIIFQRKAKYIEMHIENMKIRV